jgi:hypothetical protein
MAMSYEAAIPGAHALLHRASRERGDAGAIIATTADYAAVRELVADVFAEQRRDLMEVVDDRHQRASTILATQIPIERWHEVIGEPTTS